MLLCGFEMDTPDEISASQGIQFYAGDTYGFLSTYMCRLGTTVGDYAQWDMSDTDTRPLVASINTRLNAHLPVEIIRIVRGTKIYYVKLEDSSGDVKFTLYADGTSVTKTMELNTNRVINIVLLVGYKLAKVYADGIYVVGYSGVITGSDGNVTMFKVTNNSGSAIYIDDVALYYGSYFGGIGVIYGMRPTTDYTKELTRNAGNSNASCVDDISHDSGTTIVYSSSGNKRDVYRTLPITIPTKYEFLEVAGVKIGAFSSLSASDASASMNISVMRGTTNYDSANISLTTSYAYYAVYHEISPEGALWLPAHFTTVTDSRFVRFGIKHNYNSATIRTTQVVLCVLAIIKPKKVATLSVGGLDLGFTADFDLFTSVGNKLEVILNAQYIPAGQDVYPKPPAQSVITFQRDTTNMLVSVGNYPDGDYTERIRLPLTYTTPHKIRIIQHDKYLTILLYNSWIYTFSLAMAEYPDPLIVKFKASASSFVLTDLYLRELSDWRDAIWMDMDTPGMNSIGNIIQERPVEVDPVTGGYLDFSYNRYRSTVSLLYEKAYSVITQDQPGAGSHFVVNHEKVSSFSDTAFMDAVGFRSKYLQLSSLDSGAIYAAKQYALRARQNMERYKVTLPPDVRVEVGDLATISFTASGTNTVVSKTMIVEGINITLIDGEYVMTLEGRKYVAS